MEKVYLLLRNNLQSGPYTIDELRQQKLKPEDLIWIEGQSTAWCYPSELEDLHAGTQAMARVQVVPVPAMVVPRPVGTKRKALPADDIETQAEALRKRALSYTPGKPWAHYKPNRASDDSGTTFYRPEEDKIELVIHRRERNLVPAQLVAAAMLTALAVLVWNQRASLIPVRQAVESVAARAATFEQVSGPEEKPVPTTAAVSVTEAPATEIALPQPQEQTITQSAAQTFTQKTVPEKRQAEVVVSRAVPAVQVDQQSITPIRDEAIAIPETVALNQKPATVTESKPAAEPTAEAPAAVESEKKKTIGEALKGLFKKKKKDEDRDTAGKEGNG